MLVTGELPGHSSGPPLDPGHTAPGPRHCTNPSPDPGQHKTAQSPPSCGQQETRWRPGGHTPTTHQSRSGLKIHNFRPDAPSTRVGENSPSMSLGLCIIWYQMSISPPVPVCQWKPKLTQQVRWIKNSFQILSKKSTALKVLVIKIQITSRNFSRYLFQVLMFLHYTHI